MPARRGQKLIRTVDALNRIGIPLEYFRTTQVPAGTVFQIRWDEAHVLHLTPIAADEHQCTLCGNYFTYTISLYEKRVCVNCLNALVAKGEQEASYVR